MSEISNRTLLEAEAFELKLLAQQALQRYNNLCAYHEQKEKDMEKQREASRYRMCCKRDELRLVQLKLDAEIEKERAAEQAKIDAEAAAEKALQDKIDAEVRATKHLEYLERMRIVDAAPLMLEALRAWKMTDGTWLDERNDLYEEAIKRRDAAIKEATGE